MSNPATLLRVTRALSASRDRSGPELAGLPAGYRRGDSPLRHLLGHGSASDLLRGRALGHALHPVVVQLPIGALTSAMILDLTQGPRAARQSRLLTGLACLATLPAAATGLAEWTHADPRCRRVGIAHLGLNLLGVVGATTSYLLRRRNWTPAAAVWSGLAMAAVGLSGALGGHLTLVRKYGSHDQASDDLGASSGTFGSSSEPEESLPTE